MIERHLHEQLDRVARRLGRQRLLWRVSLCWLAGAAAGVVLTWIGGQTTLTGSAGAAWLAAAIVVLVLAVGWRARRRSPNRLWTARAIERRFPDLDDRLLAAAEQQADAPTGRLTYLQREVLFDVLGHSRRHDWRNVIPGRRLLAALAVHCVCLAAFLAATALLLKHDLAATVAPPRLPGDRAAAASIDYGLTVEPGDAEIERGTSLLILARFEHRVPASVNVVARAVNASPRTVALSRSLDDPLFGGRIADIDADFTYHVEFDGHRSPEFCVAVFDYPRLERADLTVVAPAYAGREPVTLTDARRASLLEGSEVVLVCRTNKPLAAAELTGDGDEVSPLIPSDNDETEWSVTLHPAHSTRYRLKLTDHAGRTNRHPPEFVLEVLPNRPPELKLTFPGRDVRVSPLEELSLEATVWDDLGLVRCGLVYAHDGRETTVLLDQATPGPPGPPGPPRPQEARLTHQIALEDLAAQPDELLSYYFFAEDYGPDGTIRRTASDMYFAEVRPFEEIFREGQQPGGGGAAGGGPQGQQIEQLAELQKQIVSAIWTIVRRETSAAVSETFTVDVAAVAESQRAAIEQLDELRQKLEDTKSQRFADDAEGHMRRVADRLRDAADNATAGPLTTALAAAQAAYQALLRLRAREHQIVRGEGGGEGGGGGGGEGQNRSQQQLDQLELTNKQNRYQTEQRAAAPPSADREQLQVLNRLRELARRQSGVNQQLKELELALQHARDEAERDEIRRRLKTLREEQQQVLRDLDELRDRLERPENQRNLSDARRQVDHTREQVRQASDALRDGQVSQAISSGTRAERELENLREDFRRRTAHQFADAMSDLRERARELSERQQQLGESLEQLDSQTRRSLRDAAGRGAISRELTEQKDRLADVLDRMRQIVEQAERSEPLLSKQLYDAARQARADAPEQSLDAAAELTSRGLVGEARQAADEARRGIESLRAGVEQAADAVLGNELDSLKRARDDLRQVARDLDRELAQSGAVESSDPDAASVRVADRSARSGESQDHPSTRQRPTPSQARPADESFSSSDTQPGSEDASDQAGASGQGNPPGPAPGNARSASDSSSAGESGGQGEAGGRSDGGSPRGPRNSQRPSLLSDGGQSGGAGEGPGGRAGRSDAGPLTGEGFQQWSDRLRDIEETVGDPDLRNEVSRIRERARSVRADFKRHSLEPQWDLVRTEILEPLTELEGRLAQEIARRQSADALVPIDRDPVPTRFADAVREYYERLGDVRRR